MISIGSEIYANYAESTYDGPSIICILLYYRRMWTESA